ncbi:hypothetical protein [Winogradskyella sp. PC D3.3]
MFKTLFHIVLFIVGMSVSAQAVNIELLNSDLEYSKTDTTSSEVYTLASPQDLFFDIQTEDYSVVIVSVTEPSSSDEISVNIDGITNYSNYLLTVQRSQYVKAKRNSFNNFHLRETLFPFHSFW